MAKKKKSNRLIFILLAIVVLLIIVALVGKKQGWVGGGDEIEVETAQAKRDKIIEKVSASGLIQPVNEVKISPDVSGEIIELNIEEGDSVHEGEVLIKIRPDIYQSNYERAVANLNQQKANLADAKARLESARASFLKDSLEFARNKQLFDDNVISTSDFELARANYEMSKSNLSSARESVKASRYIIKSAEAGVQEARENLRFTTITAPVSGTVSKLNVELGERVVGTQQMAGTEMLRIADLTKMEARVDVNENDIIRVKQGDSAVIEVDAYSHKDEKFKGVVTQIANTANTKSSPDAVTEFEVRIRVLNESYYDLQKEQQGVSPFRPGMTASVDIITKIEDDVLTVPLASVTTRKPKNENDNSEDQNSNSNEDSENGGEGNSDVADEEDVEVVFVVSEGKAVRKEVKTGISDFDKIEITEGIEEGEEIISGPFVVVSKRLKDGDLVKTKEKDKKGKEKIS